MQRGQPTLVVLDIELSAPAREEADSVIAAKEGGPVEGRAALVVESVQIKALFSVVREGYRLVPLSRYVYQIDTVIVADRGISTFFLEQFLNKFLR